MTRKGEHLSEEAKQKLSEKAKLRTGEKNGFFGRHHTEEFKALKAEQTREQMTGTKRSEETRKKISEANKGKHSHTPSEESRKKMSDAHKARWADPEYRAKYTEEARAAYARGERPIPPVMRGADNPNFGKTLSEEHREKIRQAALARGGHPHTAASREKISRGNAESISTRVRTYKFSTVGPDGLSIPCRSSSELRIAQALCGQTAVVAVRGEDRMTFVPYTFEGEARRTIADFEVDRADGRTVMVEVKTNSALYTDRERARLNALWVHCQAMGKELIVAFSNRPDPSVWTGPFATQAFMDLVATGKVRHRMMRTDPLAGPVVSAPSASVSATSPQA